MNSIFRIIAAFIMIASLVWGQWWLTWGLALIFLFAFPTYYEILVWGVIYDALYGIAIPQFYFVSFVFSILSIVLFLLSLLLRKLLVTHEPTI